MGDGTGDGRADPDRQAPGLRGMVALLRRRPHFRRLWYGDVVSYLGDWLTYVAVSLLALAHGDGLLVVAMVLVAHAAPHALLAPIAGSLVDRIDRRTVLVGANVIRAALTLLMALLAWAGDVWSLQAVLFLRVAVGAFFAPAQTAALPRVVERDEIQLANALASGTWSVMFSVGVALGGLVAALVGPTLAILLDSLTFVWAAVILWRLPSIIPEGGTRQAGVVTLVRELHHDLGEAWRYAWRDPHLLEAVLAKTPVLAATGGAWVLLNQLCEDLSWFGSTALTFGILQMSRGVGTAIGPLIEPRLARLTSDRTAWLVTAWVTFAACAVLPFAHGPVSLLLVTFLWGCGIGANWVAATSRLQRIGPDRLMGRLAAIDFVALTAGETIAALLGAVAGEHLLDASWAAWTGVLIGLVSWSALQALLRR